MRSGQGSVVGLPLAEQAIPHGAIYTSNLDHASLKTKLLQLHNIAAATSLPILHKRGKRPKLHLSRSQGWNRQNEPPRWTRWMGASRLCQKRQVLSKKRLAIEGGTVLENPIQEQEVSQGWRREDYG